MRRILLMILKNIFFCPYWLYLMYVYGRENVNHSEKERFDFLKKVVYRANRSGRVTIEASGLENVPAEDGFIMFPNHQGLYDVMAFIESSEHPFSVVVKKEARNIPLLKRVFDVMRVKVIDRKDIRGSMKVILEVSKEVREGRNYIIFPEGTRSKNGNQVQEFKGGSFKSAINAKCPIVPVAIINAFKPFDTHSIEPVTVQIHYLPPLYFDDYSSMKSTEIAAVVKDRIESTIKNHEAAN